MHLPDCCISWMPRLQEKIPTLCWKVYLCLKWCQESVVPCHCNPWSSNSLYLIQFITGRQCWCACNHIHECHPDAISPDAPITSDRVPTSSTSLPATLAPRSTALVTLMTWISAASHSMHPTETTPYRVHQGTYKQNPLEMPQGQMAWPKLSITNLPKSGSHHLRLSWKYRPTLPPVDEYGRNHTADHPQDNHLNAVPQNSSVVW